MKKKASFYKYGQMIMNECKQMGKKEKISFEYRKRYRRKLYAEYGDVKTYVNRKQVNKKVEQLRQLGYNVYPSCNYPFVIILKEENNNDKES